MLLSLLYILGVAIVYFVVYQGLTIVEKRPTRKTKLVILLISLFSWLVILLGVIYASILSFIDFLRNIKK